MPTVIKINAITVAPDSGDELAERFAKRAGAVDGQDGFEGFELLKPTDDRTQWLVITRWADQAKSTKPAVAVTAPNAAIAPSLMRPAKRRTKKPWAKVSTMPR